MTLTPQTLAFYSRLLDQGITSLRIPAASLLKTLVGKGIKDPAEKLQVLKILNVVSLLDPLEASTRETKGDSELVAYRVAIGGILQVFGSELVSFVDNVSDLTVYVLIIRTTIPNRYEMKLKL